MIENDAVSETTLPAGRYWIGDPCYAYEDHGVWMALLESADYTGSHRILDAEVPGERFLASGTAFGDGVYLDEDGNEYGVDAGLLGAVPAKDGQRVPSGMREVEFTEPFEVGYAEGKIAIGHIVIDTDPKVDEEWECDRCGYEVSEGEDYCYSCERDMADEDEGDED